MNPLNPIGADLETRCELGRNVWRVVGHEVHAGAVRDMVRLVRSEVVRDAALREPQMRRGRDRTAGKLEEVTR